MRTVFVSFVVSVLLVVGAALVVGWIVHQRRPRAPTHYRLTTTLAPELLAEASKWPLPRWKDTVTWVDSFTLVVERIDSDPSNRDLVGQQIVTVRFSPPGKPRITWRQWTENRSIGQSWSFDLNEGRAWISSDGQGLGLAEGPSLAVRLYIRGFDANSSSHQEDFLLLTSEQLRRK
jgi:hypothetical protein